MGFMIEAADLAGYRTKARTGVCDDKITYDCCTKNCVSRIMVSVAAAAAAASGRRRRLQQANLGVQIIVVPAPSQPAINVVAVANVAVAAAVAAVVGSPAAPVVNANNVVTAGCMSSAAVNYNSKATSEPVPSNCAFSKQVPEQASP